MNKKIYGIDIEGGDYLYIGKKIKGGSVISYIEDGTKEYEDHIFVRFCFFDENSTLIAEILNRRVTVYYEKV